MIFKSTFGKIFGQKKGDGISPVSALSAALAACMGTGNIIGVASALSLGGPGSIFWMIVSAILGEMTGFAENTLGIIYREKNSENEWLGGSMLYIEKAFGSKKFACAFCFFCIAASLGMGNMTQANSAAQAVSQQTAIYPPAFGVGLAAVCAMIIFGGVKRIAAATEKIIPPLSLAVICALAAIIIKNSAEIIPSLSLIMKGAFSFKSGAAGYTAARAIKFGIARGVFSNEAGLGSSPIVHSAADVREPVEQGMWGIAEVFIDTVLMCTLTALALLTSGAWQAGTALSPTEICTLAFESILGRKAGAFLSTALCIFAFATVVGWEYYGEKAAEYAFGEMARTPYRILYLFCTVIGSCLKLEAVWALSDVFNALMALPNLAALWRLKKDVIKEYHSTILPKDEYILKASPSSWRQRTTDSLPKRARISSISISSLSKRSSRS